MRSVVLLVFLLSLAACQSPNSEEKPPAEIGSPAPQEQASKETPPATEQQTADPAPATEEAGNEQQVPPAPPLSEDFQGKPRLSLFPRAGAFRPAIDDTQGLQFWRTYIDHLMRTSGPIKTDEKENGNTAFAFRAIKGLDSVGLFSPLAVEPDTTYRVSTTFSCDLTEGATAGIGLLEFDKFLWIGEQYPETLIKESQIGSQAGITLKGKVENQVQTFTFTTGPKTKMIHLVFYRDGAHDRNPVTIDDIEIVEK